MAGLALVSSFLKLENLFCIFRNFCYLKKRFRCVAIVCAAMQVVINVVYIYLTFEKLLSGPVNTNSFFYFQFGLLSNTNAILFILLSFKNAESFRVLYSKMSDMYNELKDCKALSTSLNKVKNLIAMLTIIYLCNYMTMLILYVKNNLSTLNESPPTFLCRTIVIVNSEFRIVIEFFAIIIFLSILHQYVKIMNVELNKTVDLLQNPHVSSNEIDLILNNMNMWFSVICNLDKCVFHTKNCFGVQVNIK